MLFRSDNETNQLGGRKYFILWTYKRGVNHLQNNLEAYINLKQGCTPILWLLAWRAGHLNLTTLFILLIGLIAPYSNSQLYNTSISFSEVDKECLGGVTLSLSWW